MGTSTLLIMPTGLSQSPCSFRGSTSHQEPAGKYPCPLPGLAGEGADGHRPLVCLLCRENSNSKSESLGWRGHLGSRVLCTESPTLLAPTPKRRAPLSLAFHIGGVYHAGGGGGCCPEKLKPQQTGGHLPDSSEFKTTQPFPHESAHSTPPPQPRPS